MGLLLNRLISLSLKQNKALFLLFVCLHNKNNGLVLSACPEQLARCFRTLSICPWPGQWCPLVLKPPSWNHSTATPINDFHPVALSPNHRQGLPDHQFTPNRSTCHIGPGPGDTPSPRPLTQPRPTWTGQNLYVRMLLTLFSSAFDTEIPS